jgi:hypothetical protein
MPKGAGGTDGGTSQFIVGLIMMIGGAYLLLNGIVVRPSFGGRVFGIGGMPVTSGMILIPLMFGIGLIFYNGKSWLGWIIAGASLIALVFGVIANTTVQFARLSVFEILVIMVLLVGGLGLFLRSLRKSG